MAQRRSWSRLAVVALLLAMVVAGCASPATTPPPTPSAGAVSPSASAATPRPSGASLAWTDCGAPFECATLSVPLDYAGGGPAVAHISLIRLPATDRARRIGSLVTNPGGPGGSGVDFVRQDATTLFPAASASASTSSASTRGASAPARRSAATRTWRRTSRPIRIPDRGPVDGPDRRRPGLRCRLRDERRAAPGDV